MPLFLFTICSHHFFLVTNLYHFFFETFLPGPLFLFTFFLLTIFPWLPIYTIISLGLIYPGPFFWNPTIQYSIGHPGNEDTGDRYVHCRYSGAVRKYITGSSSGRGTPPFYSPMNASLPISNLIGGCPRSHPPSCPVG